MLRSVFRRLRALFLTRTHSGQLTRRGGVNPVRRRFARKSHCAGHFLRDFLVMGAVGFGIALSTRPAVSVLKRGVSEAEPLTYADVSAVAFFSATVLFGSMIAVTILGGLVDMWLDLPQAKAKYIEAVTVWSARILFALSIASAAVFVVAGLIAVIPRLLR
jgi:hypothetical protein